MPFQFPDPSVATTATLPNGEIWEYANGAWQARPTQDDDQHLDMTDVSDPYRARIVTWRFDSLIVVIS